VIYATLLAPDITASVQGARDVAALGSEMDAIPSADQ